MLANINMLSRSYTKDFCSNQSKAFFDLAFKSHPYDTFLINLFGYKKNSTTAVFTLLKVNVTRKTKNNVYRYQYGAVG